MYKFISFLKMKQINSSARQIYQFVDVIGQYWPVADVGISIFVFG